MPLLKTDAPTLENVESWINSSPIDLEKEGTHLLYFWNYSCNCCRDRLKLFKNIHQEYSEIKVIGIHTPELGFERDIRNLEKAVEKLEIDHSIAHDSEKQVSKAYDMAYSNRAVLIQDGKIVYQQTHSLGKKDLIEALNQFTGAQREIKGLDKAQELSSQEFFGYKRTRGLNQEGNHPGEKNYNLQDNRKKGETYLNGKWEQKKHCIEAKGNSELRFNFESSKVGLIVDPNDGIRDIKVLIDEEPVSQEQAGEDIRLEDGRSYIRVKNPDLYSLIDSEHQEAEITLVPDKKTRLYALSFR
jgi:peroxiredoxin